MRDHKEKSIKAKIKLGDDSLNQGTTFFSFIGKINKNPPALAIEPLKNEVTKRYTIIKAKIKPIAKRFAKAGINISKTTKAQYASLFQRIKEKCITWYRFAGITATCFAWSLYNLLRNPTKLEKGHDSVFHGLATLKAPK